VSFYEQLGKLVRLKNNKVTQAESEAKSFKSLKKWFEFSTLKVTIKAEKQPGNDSRERLKKE
jgi:hypothetical protein